MRAASVIGSSLQRLRTARFILRGICISFYRPIPDEGASRKRSASPAALKSATSGDRAVGCQKGGEAAQWSSVPSPGRQRLLQPAPPPARPAREIKLTGGGQVAKPPLASHLDSAWLPASAPPGPWPTVRTRARSWPGIRRGCPS